jgi:DNA helicase-2/ATP-dependent DNA helicase PcrA
VIVVRPEQEAIAAYDQGKMGISAVPGSGKTWTLSYLAADLIRRGVLVDEQEILVVTLVNSAVDNFYRRISGFIKEFGLIPGIGYRVRTLHGLAHDIVRERPALLGLDNNFTILDEREADSILNDICHSWLQSHLNDIDPYLNYDLEESKIEWARREQLPTLVRSAANNFIRIAKDRQLTPAQLRKQLDMLPVPLSLAEMGCEIYEYYQESLSYRGAVDFDDLIRLALQALDTDALLLERLHNLWPYILEDEAQDSSRLQERILRRLTSPNANWVRVGDPNQAIYETFTTASPHYLRDFLREPDVISRDLPISGRSTPGIIRLANYLIDWTMTEHPIREARSALHAPPWIKSTSPGDPQPNPDDRDTIIRLVKTKHSPDEEVQVIVKSIKKWLGEHPGDQTIAVLAPRSQRGKDLIVALEKEGISYNDSLLGSTRSTRSLTGALGNLLRYLSAPQSSSKLAMAYRVWRRADRLDQDTKSRMEQIAELLHKLDHVEDYLWPGPQGDWLEESGLSASEPDAYAQLSEFRLLIRRWQQAVSLPIDQIILTLAQDLLTEPSELAVAHKLASLLRQLNQQRPELRLPDLASELGMIARNERRFLGFSEDEGGFDPDAHKGVVVVATMHKAKGLEWDRVYLMSVSNYDFPSGQSYDSYFSEKFFIRNSLNLEAETIAQLYASLSSDENEWYQEGRATSEARIDYIQERLRLLYVGVTRARKELIITWNTGKSAKIVIKPAIPFVALQNFQDEKGSSAV